jgi:hypothetical protein
MIFVLEEKWNVLSLVLIRNKFDRKHLISTDGGTWYPMTCKFLRLKHHNHSPYEKSIIERSVQYIKDRTECYDG